MRFEETVQRLRTDDVRVSSYENGASFSTKRLSTMDYISSPRKVTIRYSLRSS